MRGPIVSLVSASCRAPRAVLAAALLLCVVAGAYAAMNFAMTTDTAQLISPKVAWRQRQQAVDSAFPQTTDRIILVVDGKTPEIAEQAAASLADRLSQRKDAVVTLERPDGGAFFAQDGLLLLSLKEVQSTTSQVIEAQPFLGPLAADPSLRGVMKSLSAMTLGVQQGQTTLERIDKPMKGLADALETVLAGKPAYFSWEAMMQDKSGGLKTPLRRLILIRAKLDYGALEPGSAAADVIRKTAQDLHLDEAHGARVRLTGEVPLADEEFSSLADKAWLVTGTMLAAVFLMVWLATRSIRMVACILITTIVGLMLTAGLGLLAVGRFNLISVAFIPLFVGLGIDFGIQLCVRFRAERLEGLDLPTAMGRAARSIGTSLATAAAAITLGLFAFLPTNYIGVSELGVIAGLGMIIALLLTLTLLPALLTLVRPPDQGLEVGNRRLAPLDRFLIDKRKWVLGAFGVSVIISIALVPLVQFDFNPLHLRNPHREAMATLSDLMRDPDQSPNTIDILEPSLAKADAMAKRVSALSLVDQAVTLSSFVPDEQPAKLALVQDASLLLDPTINPLETTPPPTDAETVLSLTEAAKSLRDAAAASTAPAADARRLASALDALAAASPAVRERASSVIVTPLNTMLDQVRSMLAAQPVTMQSLPPVLVRDWTTPDGRARVLVFPKRNDNRTLKAFATQVRQVAPDAAGGPISVQEAAKTIADAFIEAGILSLIAVTVLLLVVLRSLKEVAFTLAPVVLSGFLTLSTCVLIGQPINFANIIAFPLLFGVGVAFHIYFVMAWRAGQKDLLQSSLTRAVFFSAMTTGMAFGSLWLSSHPGTASMGKILMISIVWTLVCALLFEPALLGPPKANA
jgi:hopanoid biosynthesis associated RND transporter like protein HpnN